MIDEKWQKVREVFDKALQVEPEERLRFVKKACGNDQELLNEVESLLASLDAADDFLETPAQQQFGSILNELILDENQGALEAGKSFNQYEIVKMLGAGGMGEVYLAKDKKLNRRVAVKILNERFSQHESNLRRFLQEAQSASALNHPNILIIHEIGESDGTNYIVSEYVEGKTLREVLKEKSLNFRDILEIAIQTANALTAAHQARIIHRDIKPENIIIRPDGLIKILDFGLAKLIENKNKSSLSLNAPTIKQNQTAKGVILGTVNYMSPEQAKGERVDERTDIFSFGSVLYEMLAAKTPFAGDSTGETYANLINQEPSPLARYTANVPDELQRIVSKTLRKNKDERYQTAKELLSDLKELKENLTFREKLQRSHTTAFDDNKTIEMPAITGDLNEQGKQTNQFSRIIRQPRGKLFVSAALLVLLSGVSFFVWHWRQNGTAAAPSEIKSLAVLPLKSLDNSENYLGLGISDAIIRRLSQTGELTVRPTSAVRHYLNEDTDALTAAKQLETDAVLEGSVQKADNRLRVSVNLLRTSDGKSIWTDSFDLPAADIFTIQDKVSQQMASRLQLQLNPDQQARLNKRSTSNPVAYDYYLRGIYGLDERGYGLAGRPQMETTIAFFKKAIEADPNYALAHAKLGYAYTWTAIFIDTQQVWADRAADEINRAQQLDPQLPEAHISRSILLMSAYQNWQIEAGAQELISAQQLNPNAGHEELGAIYFHLGLEDLVERELQRALEINSTSDSVKSAILESYSNLNKYDEWFAACQKYTPDKCNNSVWYLMGKNRLDEAQKLLDSSTATPQNPNAYRYLQQRRAKLLAMKGDFAAAEAMIPDIIKSYSINDFAYHHMTYEVACVYALAGKSAEAVKWLRETANKGFPCYSLFQHDHYLDRIRNAPEFIKFMEEQKSQNEKFRSEFQ